MDNEGNDLSSDELLRLGKEAFGISPDATPGDEPLSSEAMLAESAEALGQPPVLPSPAIPSAKIPTPPAPFASSASLGASTPPVPEPAPTSDVAPAPGSNIPPPPGPFEASRPVYSDAPAPAAAARPPAGSGVPAPPPSLPPQSAPGAAAPAPMAAPKKHRNIPWGPIVAVAVIGGLMLFGWLNNRGVTSADSLGLGDCFADPGLGDFSEVTNQDCALPHDLQVYAVVKGESFGLPGTPTPGCEEAIIGIMSSDHLLDESIIIPEDTLLNELSDSGVGSRANQEVLCIVESASGGLVGSLLPE